MKLRQRIEGQNILLDVNKIPIHDEEGNIIGILDLLEITQHQQASQQKSAP